MIRRCIFLWNHERFPEQQKKSLDQSEDLFFIFYLNRQEEKKSGLEEKPGLVGKIEGTENRLSMSFSSKGGGGGGRGRESG